MGYKDDGDTPLKADNFGEPFASVQDLSAQGNCKGASRPVMAESDLGLGSMTYVCGSIPTVGSTVYTDPLFRYTPFSMTGWNKPYDGHTATYPDSGSNEGGMYAARSGSSIANRFYHYFPANKDGDYVMLKYAEVLVYTKIELFIHFVNCILAASTSTGIGGASPWKVYAHLPSDVGLAAGDLWGNNFANATEWTFISNLDMHTHTDVCASSGTGAARQKKVTFTVSLSTPFDGVAVVRTSHANHVDYVELSAVRVSGTGFTPIELYYSEDVNSAAVVNPTVSLVLKDSLNSQVTVSFSTALGELDLKAATSNVATVSARRAGRPDTVRNPVANLTEVSVSGVRYPSMDISVNHLYFPGRAAPVRATVTRVPTKGNVTSLGYRYPRIATAWAYEVCVTAELANSTYSAYAVGENCDGWAPNLPHTQISRNQRSHRVPNTLYNWKSYHPQQALGPPDVTGEAIMYDHHALFEFRHLQTYAEEPAAHFVLDAEVIPVRVSVYYHSPTFCLANTIMLHKAACGGGASSWQPSNSSCWINVTGVSTDSYSGLRKIRPVTVRRYPVTPGLREAVDGIMIKTSECVLSMSFTGTAAPGSLYRNFPVYMDAIGVEYEEYPPLVTYTPGAAFAGSNFSDSFEVTVERLGYSGGVAQAVTVGVVEASPLNAQPAPPPVSWVATGGTATALEPIDLEVPLPPRTPLGGRGFYPVVVSPPTHGSLELLYSAREPAAAAVPPNSQVYFLNGTIPLPLQWADVLISDSRSKTWFPLRNTGHELRTQYPAKGALGRPWPRSYGFHASAWVPVDATEEDTTFSSATNFYNYATNPVPEQKLCVGFSSPVYPAGLNVVFSFGAHSVKSVRLHRYQPSQSPYNHGPADASDGTWVQFDFTPVDCDQEVQGRKQLEILFPSFSGSTPDTLYDAACVTVNTTREAVALVTPTSVTNTLLDDIAFNLDPINGYAYYCQYDDRASTCAGALSSISFARPTADPAATSSPLSYMHMISGTYAKPLVEAWYKPMGKLTFTGYAITPNIRRIAGQFISIDAIGLVGHSFPRTVARYTPLAATSNRNDTFQIALTDGVTVTQPRTFYVYADSTQTRSLPFTVPVQIGSVSDTTATVTFTAPADLPSPSGVTQFGFFYTTASPVLTTSSWLSGGTKAATGCFATPCSHVVTGLAPGQMYTFAMVCTNANGVSAKGGAASVTLPNLALGALTLASTATNFTVAATALLPGFAQDMAVLVTSYCGWALNATAVDPRALVHVSFDDWATSSPLTSAAVPFPSPKIAVGTRFFNVSVRVSVTVASTLNTRFYNFSVESSVAALQVQVPQVSITSANVTVAGPAALSTPQMYRLRLAASGALVSAGLSLASVPATLSGLLPATAYTIELLYNDSAVCPTSANFTTRPPNSRPAFFPNPSLVGHIVRPAMVLALTEVFNTALGISMGTDAGENATQVVAEWILVSLDPGGVYLSAPSVNAAGKLTFTANPPASFPAGQATLSASVAVRDDGGTAGGGLDTSDAVGISLIFRRGEVSAVALNLTGTEASTLAFNLSLNFVPTAVVDVHFTVACSPLGLDPSAGLTSPISLAIGEAWRSVPVRVADDLIQSSVAASTCTITFTTLASADSDFPSYPYARGPPAPLAFTFAEDDLPAAILGGPMTFALGGPAVSLNGYLIFNLSIGATVTGVAVAVSAPLLFSAAPGVSIAGANGTLAFTPAAISAAPGTSTLHFTLTYSNGFVSPQLGPVVFTFTSVLATVTGASPPSGPLAGGTVVTLAGSGFGVAAANLTSLNVTDGNFTLPCAARSWLSPTSLTCTVPARPASASSSTLGFAVGVAGMPPGPVSPQIFTYNPAAAVGAAHPPSMLALNGNVTSVVITASAPTATLALSGADIASVTLAGVPCSAPVWINASALSCTPGLSPSGARAGPVVVTTLSAGASVGGAGATFAYRSASISAASPAGCALAGGCLITLSGSGFASGVPGDAVAAVTLAGRNCSSPSVVSDVSLVCVVDGAPAPVALGAASLATTLGGPTTLAGVFTFFVAPDVLSANPPSGAMAGGYSVLVSGNLLGNSSTDLASVWLGATRCSAAAWVSPTLVNCTAGAAASAGAVAVTVSLTGAVFGVSASQIFTYTAPATNATPSAMPSASASAAPSLAPSLAPSASVQPEVAAIVPALGYTPGGEVVTMLGRNFGADRFALISVRLGTRPCKLFAWMSASAVTCTTPAGPVGLAPAFVETKTFPSGASRAGALFEYVRPNPQLLGLFPRDVRPAGGDAVTIVGKYFGATAAEAAPVSVLFEGAAPCTSPRWLSDSTISCSTPPVASLGAGVTSPSVAVRVGTSPAVGSSIPASVARLRYRDPPYVFCNPPCGFHGNCVSTLTSASCVCDKGFKPPPSCDSPTIIIEVPSFQSSEDDGKAAEVRVSLGLAPAGPVAVSVALRFLESTTGARPAFAVLEAPASAVLDASNFEVPRVFKLGAPRDDLRSGKATYEAVVSTSSPLDPQFDAVPIAPVSLVHADARPSVASVRPTVLPLAGGTLTIKGDHFDSAVRVNIQGTPANVTAVVTRSGKRILIDPAVSTILKARAGRLGALQRAIPADELETVTQIEFASPPILSAAGGQYAKLEVLNMFEGSLVLTESDVYYTEDCPSEGLFGRGAKCTRCPEGAVCPGGWRMRATSGFWNPGEDFPWVVPCDPPDACLGWTERFRVSLCAPGYTGYACSQCLPGYFKLNGLCQVCPQPGPLAVFLTTDILVWVMYALAGAFLENREHFSLVIGLIMSVQQAGSVGSQVASELPSWVLKVYEVAHLFAGDIAFIKPDCLGRTPFEASWLIKLSYTILTGLPIILFTLVGRFFSTRYHRSRNAGEEIVQGRYAHYSSRLRRVCLVHLMVTYLTLANIAFRAIACERTPGGAIVSIGDPEHRCFSPVHLPVFIVGVIMLLGLIGFPVSLLLFYKVNSALLYSDHAFQMRWDSPYVQFHYKWRLTWLFDMLVGFSIALTSTFFQIWPKTQLAILISVFSLYAVFLIAARPYRNIGENVASICLQCCNSLITVIIYLQKTSEGGMSRATRLGLVSTSCALFAIAILYQTSAVIYQVFVKWVPSEVKLRDSMAFAKNENHLAKNGVVGEFFTMDRDPPVVSGTASVGLGKAISARSAEDVILEGAEARDAIAMATPGGQPGAVPVNVDGQEEDGVISVLSKSFGNASSWLASFFASDSADAQAAAPASAPIGGFFTADDTAAGGSVPVQAPSGAPPPLTPQDVQSLSSLSQAGSEANLIKKAQ